tara:strand:+ start:834 stop:2873 length:2040 start_codon:yes stop_codon:yes gene_type:complete
MAIKLWEKVNNLTGLSSKSRSLLPSLEAGARFLVASLPEKFLWSIASTIEVNGWSSSQTASVEATCTRTADSPTVTLSSITGLQVDMLVSGTGIPDGTTISSITAGTPNSLGLSKDATASGESALTFKHSLSEGSGISYDKILSVYREDGHDSNGNVIKRIAEEVSDKGVHIFDESSSLLRPTKMFPKFYKLGGKIYIKPSPDYNDSTTDQSYTKIGDESSTPITAGTGDKGVIVYAAPPTIDENSEQWILAEYENVAIYYAASLDMKRLCQSYRDDIKTHLGTITGTYLSNFEGNLPVMYNITPPDKPSLPDLTSSPVTVTMDNIPDYVDQSVPNLVGISLPTIPNIQTISYNGPSHNFNDSFSPSTPLPSFSKPLSSFNWTETDDALQKAKNLIDSDSDIGGDLPGTATDFSSAQEWLHEEDPEMVTAILSTAAQELSRSQIELSKQQRELERFSQDVDAESQKFNGDLTKYRAEIERLQGLSNTKTQNFTAQVEDAQLKMQQQLEQYKSDLGRYSTNCEMLISEYGQKSGTDISLYQAKFQEALQKYSSKSDSSIQKFTNEVQKQVAEEGRKVQEFTAKTTQLLQKYSAEIQSYSTEVQSEAQKYTNGLQKASSYFGEANALMQVVGELNAECQMAQQDSQDYYQRAVNELRAITGVLTAPEQQQQSQRKEQGAST